MLARMIALACLCRLAPRHHFAPDTPLPAPPRPRRDARPESERRSLAGQARPRVRLGAGLPLWLLVLSLAAGAQAAGASVSVQHLTCEYLSDPLGVEARAPRLSWQLLAVNPRAHGQRQTAYRVLVASSATLLARNQGDLWDSGWVGSDQSQLVPYTGRPLRSGQACFWKVRAQDEARRSTPWSRPGTWSMGLLAAADWTAQWIGARQEFRRRPGSPPPDNDLPDPWLRKTITLPAAPRRALMYVASIGYHELYVNGQKVGPAVLMPCVSDHNVRARYVTYDLAPYLHAGPNALGLWLGASWSLYPPYHPAGAPRGPIAIAQTDLEFPDGQTVRVVSDGTWKEHPSPNTTLGVWDFTNFGGERYDARQELTHWSDPHLDDRAWSAATVWTPHLILSPQNVEPNRPVEEIRPVSIAQPSPGIWRVDMGVNFSGWLEVAVRGQPGDVIELKLSERQEAAMTHRLHDTYIIGPSGHGVFRNHFNYGTARWVQLEGLRQPPTLTDLRGWLVRTDYRRTTRFACSNPLLNEIYNATVWTWQNLSLGGYSVDCPQRERMGYGGDAHATTETALDNFSLGAFYTKWSQDWRDVQGLGAAWGTAAAHTTPALEAGNLPYTAPTLWGGGGPAWSGYCVTLPWLMYRHFGDTRILADNLETIHRWLAFLDTKARHHLLRRWGGEWDFLGDWLWPGAEGVNGDTRETLFFNNCYWVYNLQTAARIAVALGNTNLARQWQTEAAAIKTALQHEFAQPAGGYVNAGPAYLALALLIDLPPADQRARVEQLLIDQLQRVHHGHFWAGITGGYFLIQSLLALDRPDLMYLMANQTDYPSWGNMLRHGATTLWEDWEGKLSLCHSSYLHIGAWFIEGLAGIQPADDGRGYQRFALRPGLWPDCPLQWVRCSMDSPYGIIQSDWRRTAAGLLFEITVPPNTEATAYLPAHDPAAVSQGGRALGPRTPARTVSDGGHTKVAVQLPAGHYRLEVHP